MPSKLPLGDWKAGACGFVERMFTSRHKLEQSSILRIAGTLLRARAFGFGPMNGQG
jgi:hypothetical protein